MTRRLVVRIADTAGIVIQAEWPIPDGAADSHDDAINLGLGLYREMNGEDAPLPASVEITSTFMEAHDHRGAMR